MLLEADRPGSMTLIHPRRWWDATQKRLLPPLPSLYHRFTSRKHFCQVATWKKRMKVERHFDILLKTCLFFFYFCQYPSCIERKYNPVTLYLFRCWVEFFVHEERRDRLCTDFFACVRDSGRQRPVLSDDSQRRSQRRPKGSGSVPKAEQSSRVNSRHTKPCVCVCMCVCIGRLMVCRQTGTWI